MKKLKVILSLALALITVFLSEKASAQYKNRRVISINQFGETVEATVLSREFLINFKTANRDTITALLKRYQLSSFSFYQNELFGNEFGNWVSVSTDSLYEEALPLWEKIMGENPGLIQNAEPIFEQKIFSLPNDSLFSQQWYLHDDSTNHDINWPQAIAIAAKIEEERKREIIIGIMDTGLPPAVIDSTGAVDSTKIDHPDFPPASILRWGKTYTRNPEEGTIDKHGHGTAVASIIFAITNNEKGLSGITGTNTLIKGIAHKTFDNRGSGWSDLTANAIIDLVNSGVDIISYSGGSIAYSEIIESAIAYAHKKGILIVCAAGNSGHYGVAYPARLGRIGVWRRSGYPNVLAIGATDQEDNVAYFSSRGPEVFIAAPGERRWPVRANRPEDEISVVVATPTYTFWLEGNGWGQNYFLGARGTSFATPIVSGVAALMMSCSKVAYSEVREILKNTAKKVGSRPYTPDEAGDLFNTDLGYGRIDAEAAMRKVVDFNTGIKENVIANVPPSDFELFQNYPNPFNPSTNITFTISKPARVSLKIYNVMGQEIATLVNEQKKPGTYTTRFNAEHFSSGIYFYTLSVAEKKKTKRMLIVK